MHAPQRAISDSKILRRGEIAAVLSVKYRKLLDGEFNHTSVLTLVDAEGVVIAQSAKIPGIDDAFFRAIKEQL